MPSSYTEAHERDALEIGALRQRAGAGFHNLGLEALGDPAALHALGALGELLVAEYLGLEASVVDRGGGPDQGFDFVELGGLRLEVRTRDKRERPWGDLILRTDKPLKADAVVLVWIEPGRRYTLPGWAMRAELESGCVPLERRDGMRLRKYPHHLLRPIRMLAP